ncbi:MAG: hypothetical protein A3G32_09290 [Deltaproteobacteria bacterium RIFCSPLOWO2_12_FULL_40_28]|nr:MAG: hypothetical protein A3C45_07565 [Deltaproteobacteria bacterium RIFCSPHIGHO2_02_FULL_40_28]OGQ20089.1 MAG: hypothetical protein A3E27_08740 [Deltaproteobacteria bacterium RIFCSPHIGHO2_12_FULL_40_32]OGQ40021.1 MAG: hypothetical protein A3I69_08850 [Deltaproteobacteria bacterium RIFCSPLOWO2_02_FULL_40_36]OGQ55338.1 MAG: hypothetical protein A3G32_09290 [Deltaproteobacteria bacterium RIFCSPLOWO2_12_FULL_40_28]
MSERRVLGKGLSSLISGSRSSDAASKVYFEANIDDVVPNQNQPRKLFDKASIDELAASIEEKGILQPLIVREMGGGKYELVAGERRYRAAKLLHLKTVPVIVKDIDPQEILELALIENIQRQDLNPIEEALAYKELLGRYQYTQDELAKRLGKDRSSIANTLRLLKLPEVIRSYIIAGQLSMGHARTILGIDNKELQEKLADEIIKNGMSVREVEEWIRKLKDEGINEKPAGDHNVTLEVVRPKKENKFLSVEESLKKFFRTKVQIKSVGQKGKIIIYFHNPDELNGLLQQMGYSG